MKAAEMKLLERAFVAEINGALAGGTGLLQTFGKAVQGLVESGHLEPHETVLGRDRFGEIRVSGYRLTHLGRLTYCMSCEA